MKSFLLLSLLVLTACTMDADESYIRGTQSASQEIISGDKVVAGSLISNATVYLRLPTGTFCSGVLLNDHVVLTAAHCASRFPKGDGISVLIPEADKSCMSSAVSDSSIAPKISEDHAEPPDLALLKLKNALCALPAVTLADEVNENDILFAAGFGADTAFGLPEYLSLRIVSSDKNYIKDLFLKDSNGDAAILESWNQLEPYFDGYVETSLLALASNPVQSLCFGDSGGPVYREESGALKIFGVNTGGIFHPTKGVRSCRNAYLQMITPVGPSMKWLESVLQSW